MNYTMKAVKTKYNGVNFRSRLEAKWAALFDLLGWEWAYEPIDFNGWMPDFAILGRTVVYVEVKPILRFDQSIAKKMNASGCQNEMIIVGLNGPRLVEQAYLSGSWPHRINIKNDCFVSLGWLNENQRYADFFDDGAGYGIWDEARLGRWQSSLESPIGFCSESGSYSDRITGQYNGNCGGEMPVTIDEIDFLWREAGNITQYTHSAWRS